MKWLNRFGGKSLPKTKTPVPLSNAPLKNHGGALVSPLQHYYDNNNNCESHGKNTRFTKEGPFQNNIKYYCTVRTIKGGVFDPHRPPSFVSPSSALFVSAADGGKTVPNNRAIAQSIRKFHIQTTTAPSTSLKNKTNKDKMMNGPTKANIGGDRDSVTISDNLSSDEVQLEMDRLLTEAYKESRTISKLVQDRKKRYRPSAKDGAENCSTKYSSFFMDESVQVQKNLDEQRQNVLEDLRDETNVVKTLLTMTSHQYFPQALEQLQQRKQSPSSGTNEVVSNVFGSTASNTTEPQFTKSSALLLDIDVSASLHCTFLSVVNWLSGTLCSLPPSSAKITSVDDRGKVGGLQSSSGTKNVIKYDTSLSLEYLTTKESILLTYILDLSERMRELNLPLTIPQYQTLMTMIARHSSGMDGEVSMILLNMSKTACQIFGFGSLTGDFFVGALKELIDRNYFRDAVMLLQGMKNIHGINGVRLQDGIELLNFLKMRVDDFIAERLPLPVGFDEADAVELSLFLQRPIMNELKAKQKALESYAVGTMNDDLTDAIESLVDEYEDEEYDEEMEDDLSSTSDDNENDLWSDVLGAEDDEPCAGSDLQTQSGGQINYEGFSEDLEKLNEMVDTMKLSKDDDSVKKQANELAISIIDNIKRSGGNKYRGVSSANRDARDAIAKKGEKPLDVSTRIHVDPSTGEVDNLEISFTSTPSQPERDRQHKKNDADVNRNEILDFVYCRDGTWEIPDVVSQLEEWNGNKKIFLSKEYEDEIANALSSSDDIFLNKNLGLDVTGHDDEDDK